MADEPDTHLASAPEAARRRRRLAAWGGAVALLMLPLAAMQAAGAMNWGPADFGLAAALVASASAAFEFATRVRGDPAYRAAVALALATAFVLIWLNLAVGVIGAEDNPANLAFLGVLAVGGVGAAVARLRPRGMSLALGATALAQGVVGLAALAAGFAGAGLLTIALTAPWLASAGLFRRAACAPAP